MELSELTRLRQHTPDFIPSDIRRAKIDQDVACFLAAGGVIQKVAVGVSQEWLGDAGTPVDSAKRQIQINARAAKSLDKARRRGGNATPGAPKITDHRFIGAVCNVCRNNVRFNSNAECVTCNANKKAQKA